MKLTKATWLIAGPLLGLIFYGLLRAIGLSYEPAAMAGITLMTVVWWVSEPIPIPVTSLLPFGLLPLFGILSYREVSTALGSPVISLLLGGFILAKSLEKSGVHKRLAVYMVQLVGGNSGRRLVFGFMIASAVLSMWISNTATTLIMLPMALVIVDKVNDKKLSIALILGVAYAASVGGVGTLIGTPPNAIFAAVYTETTGMEFSFLDWMLIGVPIVIIAIPLMALWLTRNLSYQGPFELPKLSAWQAPEKRTLWVFGITIIAWITRSDPFGGWSTWLGTPGVGDATVAMLATVVLFTIPDGRGSKLMDWDTAIQIPWGMLLLFAGGIAIAKGFSSSGLSDIIASFLVAWSLLHTIVLLLLICLLVTYLTEITSNTATATLLMPILAAAATSTNNDPALFMIPAAICASCAFMLPVATAPNAIVYGSGRVTMQDMVKEGAVLSLVLSLLVAIACYFLLA